jgi:hypothetical protein
VRTQERVWVSAHSRGFQGGGRHLDSSEAVTLRGVAVEASLRPVRRDSVGTPATEERRVGDPGARKMFEEGSSHSRESFSRALPAHAIQHGAKAPRVERGSLVIGVPSRASARESSVTKPVVAKATRR